MSKTKTAKSGTKFTKILTYILYVMLILAVAGVAAVLVKDLTSSSGMYVVYAEDKIFSDNDGITIEWDEETYTAEFTISNTGDWGIYSVQDCEVKIVPHVSELKDFTFDTSTGKSFVYGNLSDLTAAFMKNYTTYDGNGLSVSEDGTFTLYFDKYYTNNFSYSSMENALIKALYKDYGELTIETSLVDKDISVYPYFSIQITSPDSGSIVEVPFAINGGLDYTASYGVSIANYDVVYYSSFGVSSEISEGGTLAVSITVTDDYVIESFTLTNCFNGAITYDGMYAGNTVSFEINNATGPVLITLNVTAASEYETNSLLEAS